MFERSHHRQIAELLSALDAGLLRRHGCLFGGGTAIALRHGEYRESVNVDFLVSDLAGYRGLRQLLTGPRGLDAVARKGSKLELLREMRADQYGLRALVGVGDAAIKFEIVLEARLQLDEPTAADVICGVATLTPLDMVASKLLANSDRWADDSVFSRDLIDLAMIRPGARLAKLALAKAEQAYGASVQRDLVNAIDRLLARAGRLERCMEAMQMTLSLTLVRQRIRALVPKQA